MRPDSASTTTLALRGDVEAALADGRIDLVVERSGRNYYYCCPWSAICQVRRPVTIGGHSLTVPQQLTLDVSFEQLAEGGQFVRRVLVGPFHDTDDNDYCDPEAGSHHD